MSTFSDKIKGIASTQVMVSGVNLSEFIDSKFIKDVSNRLLDEGEVVVSAISLQVVRKKPSMQQKQVKKDEKKGEVREIKINVISSPNILIEHPSFQHFKDRVAVVTSNNSVVLGKFLGKIK
jgi:hypothetical protein